ncbi:MAG: Fur family transcriptional regulator [Pseudomonadota bacterium]
MGKKGDALRAEVIDALERAEGPLSAYDILAELRGNHPKIAPTTIYRALAALSESGKIHRLESLNAYLLCGCDEHGHDHDAILSICDDCGTVEETVAPELLASMSKVLGKSGFEATRHVVEIHGTCADCGPEQTNS